MPYTPVINERGYINHLLIVLTHAKHDETGKKKIEKKKLFIPQIFFSYRT